MHICGTRGRWVKLIEALYCYHWWSCRVVSHAYCPLMANIHRCHWSCHVTGPLFTLVNGCWCISFITYRIPCNRWKRYFISDEWNVRPYISLTLILLKLAQCGLEIAYFIFNQLSSCHLKCWKSLQNLVVNFNQWNGIQYICEYFLKKTCLILCSQLFVCW